MEYIQTEKEYFKNFIEGNFEDYIARKRTNGEWGDDVEIQAMSEIYDRPIEIYAYDTKPMKTFHEQAESSDQIEYKNAAGEKVVETVIPFSLSFHGSSHYNCIVSANWTASEAVLGDLEPGKIENDAISWAIDDQKQRA